MRSRNQLKNMEAKCIIYYPCCSKLVITTKTKTKLLSDRNSGKVVNLFSASFLETNSIQINPIQDGLFRARSRMEGGGKAPLSKICRTYPTMMKLGTVIPYLQKIQK